MHADYNIRPTHYRRDLLTVLSCTREIVRHYRVPLARTVVVWQSGQNAVSFCAFTESGAVPTVPSLENNKTNFLKDDENDVGAAQYVNNNSRTANDYNNYNNNNNNNKETKNQQFSSPNSWKDNKKKSRHSTLFYFSKIPIDLNSANIPRNYSQRILVVQ